MEIFKRVSESAKTLTDSVADGAKTISRKSSDLVGVAKLKYEMNKLEREMENNLSALGNLMYLQYKGENDLEAEMERLLVGTKALEDDIADYKLQIDKVLPKSPICPSCQAELPSGANYCFVCGTKIAHDESQE